MCPSGRAVYEPLTNILGYLHRSRRCPTRVDAVHCRIEKLLEVKHDYLCCRELLMSRWVFTAHALPSFRWAPLFARSIARTRIRSARADWV
jgi:hypothetical protein